MRQFCAGPAEGDWRDGTFVTAWTHGSGTASVAISQPRNDALDVAFAGIDSAAGLERVRTMLGLSVDLTPFHAAAAGIDWLRALDARLRGTHPARLCGVWEAGVNAIVFQSVSMLAAAPVLARLVDRFAHNTFAHGRVIRVFPAPTAILASSDADLLATGMSRAKAIGLHALASAVLDGTLDDARLAALSTPDVCRALTGIRGLGPWSAAVIALRGFGRLEVFPARDSGVVRSVARLSSDRGDSVDAASAACAALDAQRGMLYHYLLLERLIERGALDRPCERGVQGVGGAIGP